MWLLVLDVIGRGFFKGGCGGGGEEGDWGGQRAGAPTATTTTRQPQHQKPTPKNNTNANNKTTTNNNQKIVPTTNANNHQQPSSSQQQPSSTTRYQHAELRISVYGRKPVEWDVLASWVVANGLWSNNVVWLVQIPRLYNVYRDQVMTTTGFISNIMEGRV